MSDETPPSPGEAAPPPPPPPPPPPGGFKQVEGAPPEVTSPDNDRANLMDSIRSTGGFARANLKRPKQSNTKARKGPMGRGDLMGNLNAMMGGGRGGRGGRGVPIGGRGMGMPPRR